MRPVARQTTVADEALRRPIVDQMIGKASGGGVHVGRRRSALAAASPSRFGRELSGSENTRDLTARNKNADHTAGVAALDDSSAAGAYVSIKRKSPAMVMNCVAVRVGSATMARMSRPFLLTAPVLGGTAACSAGHRCLALDDAAAGERRTISAPAAGAKKALAEAARTTTMYAVRMASG